ncbi:hypothetical protein EVAR_74469_1 [Eumeta japonica]|uniref:Uncharacterized protein n=1 Tax=Eumeta variegata TaxID=151549 RepID=A0A4C1TCH9_EUMVA|nr:hypothetical protein EVAR_74469_1 [Eumeta japonica]
MVHFVHRLDYVPLAFKVNLYILSFELYWDAFDNLFHLALFFSRVDRLGWTNYGPHSHITALRAERSRLFVNGLRGFA